jgi:signal transduction histidine kinase
MDIALFLSRHRDRLVDCWKVKLRSSLYRGPELTDQQLLDSLHVFLDQVIEGLSSGSGALARDQRSAVASEHGNQRHQLRQDIYNVVREYDYFLECVEEVSRANEVSVDAAELLSLSRLLNAGAAEAAREYAEQARIECETLNSRHFAFLAHELRNPLYSARLAWDTLRRHGGDQAHVRAGGMIGQSLSRLAELIDEALTDLKLKSMRAGAIAVQRVRVEVPVLLRQLVEESSVDAHARDLSVVVDAPAGLTIDADPRLLRSALSNLVRNAIKFSTPGGQVVLRAKPEEHRVLVEVEDQCGGLPPDAVERVFEAFSQSGGDRTGFGLGLAITKHAIEAHGGTLTVLNAPPKGCVFVIDLPAAAAV